MGLLQTGYLVHVADRSQLDRARGWPCQYIRQLDRAARVGSAGAKPRVALRARHQLPSFAHALLLRLGISERTGPLFALVVVVRRVISKRKHRPVEYL